MYQPTNRPTNKQNKPNQATTILGRTEVQLPLWRPTTQPTPYDPEFLLARLRHRKGSQTRCVLADARRCDRRTPGYVFFVFVFCNKGQDTL
jgi:hypothetical protein